MGQLERLEEEAMAMGILGSSIQAPLHHPQGPLVPSLCPGQGLETGIWGEIAGLCGAMLGEVGW
jgi:hypothetical protein